VRKHAGHCQEESTWITTTLLIIVLVILLAWRRRLVRPGPLVLSNETSLRSASERLICREVQVNLAYRWFCRLGIEDAIPDHSAFSRARNERFREGDVFCHVLSPVECADVLSARPCAWINCQLVDSDSPS